MDNNPVYNFVVMVLMIGFLGTIATLISALLLFRRTAKNKHCRAGQFSPLTPPDITNFIISAALLSIGLTLSAGIIITWPANEYDSGK